MKRTKESSVGKVITAALLAAFVLKTCVFDFMIIEGASMLPALKGGSVQVVNKLAYGIRLPWMPGRAAPGRASFGRYIVRWTFPQKNDIVVFYTPSGEIAVKRCAGLLEDDAPGGSGVKKRFLAFGDNSAESYDSRAYGPVPADSIIGKVMWKK
jgi:signal peptidase I